MKCPKDSTSLEFFSNSRGNHFTCPKCEGVYYSKQYVEAFKYNYHSDILDQLFVLSDNPDKSQLNCPQCDLQMCVKKFATYDVEMCTDCHSIWFDKHELEKIIYTYGQQPSSGESELLTILGSWLG